MNSLFNNKITRLIIPVFAILFFLSCQKEFSIDGAGLPGQLPDLTTKVTSSVSGFVTDENDAPVVGSLVTAGTGSATTDKYGYFQIKNTQVVKNAAVVTVNKSGYFKGIKTYIAENNKSAFFRIKLIPKTNEGTINAVSGGNVTLTNGLIVALPANGVINASSNAAYTGTVNVAAHWINPTANDLVTIMPGDLRGIDAAGSIKRLTSYGMAAVELTGASGELLQIAPGKKATLTMPVPASINSTAPSSIPLWSFDETTGLWKEEGQATKTGSTYVGEVSHFSFWNCDVPSNYVHFDCTVVDPNGSPIPWAFVKISVVGYPNNAGFGWTDSSGYTGGYVPDNAQLLLEVYNYYSCGTAIYSQNFSTTNTSISLGNITINNTTNIASLSGTVTDCNNAPVTNGFIILLKDNSYYRMPLSSTGTYNFNSTLCNSSNANVVLIGEDLVSGQQSAPLNYTINPGNNVIPNIQACGVVTQEFINYTVNDGSTTSTYGFSSPSDSFYHFINTQTVPVSMQISANHFNGGTTTYSAIDFTQSGVAAGSSQLLINFYASQILDTMNITTPITVNITEFGSVGQFIAGNFTGSFTGGAPLNRVYNVTCNFRTRRLQ